MVSKSSTAVHTDSFLLLAAPPEAVPSFLEHPLSRIRAAHKANNNFFIRYLLIIDIMFI
jgi:hypothetical protein